MSRRFAGTMLALSVAFATPVFAAGPVPGASTWTPPSAALRQAAASGNVHAQLQLADALQKSTNPSDQAAAVGWLRKAALAGDPDGAWRLGVAYALGNGVARDPAAGIPWMQRGVDGSATRMLIVGMFLQAPAASHRSGKADFAPAAEWFRKAAEAGSPMAMMFLASLQADGRPGVPKDPHGAAQWAHRAARTGDPAIEGAYGLMLLAGPLPRDAESGLRWLRKSAATGYAQSEGMLAATLVTGKYGVPKNPGEGVAWARKAVAQDNALGYYALGLAYRDGVGGLPKDAARAWYNLAAAQRTDTAHALTKVAMHMSEAATGLSTAEIGALRARVAKIPLPAKPDSFSFGLDRAQLEQAND